MSSRIVRYEFIRCCAVSRFRIRQQFPGASERIHEQGVERNCVPARAAQLVDVVGGVLVDVDEQLFECHKERYFHSTPVSPVGRGQFRSVELAETDRPLGGWGCACRMRRIDTLFSA